MTEAIVIAATYLQLLDADSGVQTDRHTFSAGGGRDVLVDVIRVGFSYQDGSVITFCGTVAGSSADDTGHCFVALSAAPPSDVSDVAAAAHNYDRTVAPLGVGHTFPLPVDSRIRLASFTTVVVLDASIFVPFAGSGELQHRLGCHFLAVIPITDEELTLKKRGGWAALLEAWDDTGRDILTWSGLADFVAPRPTFRLE